MIIQLGANHRWLCKLSELREIKTIGNIVPIETVYIDAVEGGRVEEKYVETGTVVTEGDVIVKLSNTNLALSVMLREAELFAHSNNLRNTRLSRVQRKNS